MRPLVVFLALRCTAASPTAFGLDLLLSRDVMGAAYPVTRFGVECTPAQYNTSACSCFGGAPRRQSVLASIPGSVRVDTGGYFFGSGLFFPHFRGNASAQFFADAEFSASGLTYRDFNAGVSAEDPIGSTLLAQYMAAVRTRNAASPAPVATNVALEGTPLEGLVASYWLTQLNGGRRLAFLNLVDPTYLRALNPLLGARVRGYRHALHIAMYRLRSLPGGFPEVVVLSLDRLSGVEGMRESDADDPQRATAALHALVRDHGTHTVPALSPLRSCHSSH
jgi:hypothetical protein